MEHFISDDTDDPPTKRRPMLGALIAAATFFVAVYALWHQPWLTIGFAAGCCTALFFDREE